MRSSSTFAVVAIATMAVAQSNTLAPTTTSLYLPFGGDNLAASIITAAPSATVYAIGCEIVSDACAPGCSLDSSVTITEGESTLRYTWSNGQHAIAAASGTALVPDVTTVACQLYGGTSATSAVCTAMSALDKGAMGMPMGPGMGLGNNGTQTTTLVASQMSYVPITVTASGSMGPATNTVSGPSSSGSSSSGVPMQTTNAGVATTASSYGALLVALVGAMMLS
ncbi:hypothetical protein LTR27_006763 [Elasticomyces elasticus]|nr:hypothetical protein LTR27_006763 [Elasticomyces elasticus]